MALQKTLEFKGLSLSYHKIIDVKNDYLNNKSKIILGAYINKASRDENIRNYHTITEVIIDGVDLTREGLYEAIKNQPIVVNRNLGQVLIDSGFFSDAVNC